MVGITPVVLACPKFGSPLDGCISGWLKRLYNDDGQQVGSIKGNRRGSAVPFLFHGKFRNSLEQYLRQNGIDIKWSNL